jgi:chemotaxis signal transduction protein
MLLIMCHCRANRYAIDSRHVKEVLPRANLHALTGSPSWLAGMLICHGSATPVMDLSQLTEGEPCPNRLSSRIVVLQTELGGSIRQLGVLAERVGLREIREAPGECGGETDGPAALGTLCLDEQGVFQFVAIPRLVPENRRAILFSAISKDR